MQHQQFTLEELYSMKEDLEKKIFLKEFSEYKKEVDLTKEEEEEVFQEIQKCEDFYTKVERRISFHFGYPGNYRTRSPIARYLERKETGKVLLNNIGDVFDSGNSVIHAKEIENEILKMFADKFGISDCYWGYITSGGSESNTWGINEGNSRLHNSKFYFCEASHYSVYKSGAKFDFETIPQIGANDERINIEILFEKIQENFRKYGQSANILLTWGTTKCGSIDDVTTIKKWLVENNIPHYIHLDAALFGGIPNNQIGAPVITDLRKLGADSISVSLHKYIGLPQVKSVLLSVNQDVSGSEVDYIGQKDTTSCGSRTITPFFTKQTVKEILHHSHPNEYMKNIQHIEELLNEYGISFVRNPKSNIVIVDAPSSYLCRKYQLSTFTNGDGEDKAHIIPFPFHDKDNMRLMVSDFAQEIFQKEMIENDLKASTNEKVELLA